MTDKILSVIETSELFGGLAPSLLSKIADAAREVNVNSGELLFQQGDPANAIWGVISGRVKEIIRSEDGHEMTVRVIENGEIFGAVGVLDWGTRRVEAVAADDSILFRISRREFLELLQTSPELCFRVFSLLCSHLRGITEALEDVALQKFPARLARKLTSLAATNRDKPNAKADIAGANELHISQSELALLIGGKREPVNRQLRAWEDDGLVTLGRQKIVINDLKKLELLAGNDHELTKKYQNFNGSEVPFAPMEYPSVANLGAKKKFAGGVRNICLMAVVVSDYSRDMMEDAAGTMKTLKAGIAAIEKSVFHGGGSIIGQVGDSIIVEFPDSRAALRTAKSIQRKITPAKKAKTEKGAQPKSLFRLGVHAGEIMVDGNRYIGPTINITLHLAQLAEAGGFYLSAAAQEHMDEKSRGELSFLGNQKLPNIEQPIPVYSAKPVSLAKRLLARAGSLVSPQKRSVATLGGMVALLIIVWLSAWQFQPATIVMIPANSIAVLPFANAGDQENNYLAAGLSQEVRSALMAFPNLKITGEKSVNYFRDKNASAEEIADVLQVSYLMLGSIDTPDGKILLSVQLFDAKSATEVWTRTYSEPAKNMAKFRRDIVQSLESTFDLSRDPGDGGQSLAAAAKDPGAYRLYLQAKFLNKQGMQNSNLSAVPLLREAIEIEPRFAEAWALLAKIYKNLNPVDHTMDYTVDELAGLSQEALAKGVEFGPKTPEVVVTAAILNQDFEIRKRLLASAVALYPNNSDALLALAWIYQEENNFAGFLETLERVLLVDPLARAPMNIYAVQLMNLNRLEDSKAVLNRLQTLYPNLAPPYAILSGIAMRERNYVRAVELARDGRPFGGFPDLWFEVKDFDWNIQPRIRAAGPYAYIGDYDTAREILTEAFQNNPDHYGHLIARGELAALAGDYTAAIALFEKAMPLLPEGEVGLCWPKTYAAWLSWQRMSCPGAALLHAYRRAGESQKADRLTGIMTREMKNIRAGYAAAGAPAEYMSLYLEAEIQAINGLTAEALATLRKWREFDPYQFSYVRRDPFFENLHGEPEFWQIVADLETDLAELRAEIAAIEASG